MIIAFSGTDGAGKSTQIDLLKSYVVQNGRSAKIIWARGGYTPTFVFLKKLLRKILPNHVPKPGQSVERDEMFENARYAKLWLTLSIIDLAVYYGVYVRGLSMLGRIVICDRYVEDTRLDFELNWTSHFDRNQVIWKALERIAPKPTVAFLLYVPIEESKRRSEVKREPFPDSCEVLRGRLAAYLDERQFPSGKFLKIDCQQSVDEVQYMIQRRIRGFL